MLQMRIFEFFCCLTIHFVPHSTSITPPQTSHNFHFLFFIFYFSCVVPIGGWDPVMLALVLVVLVLVGSSCSCFSMLVIVLDCCIRAST